MYKVHEMGINEVSVITVRLNPGDTRVCDYCNKILMACNGRQTNNAGKGGENALVVQKRCHSTRYGLVCDECKEDIRALRTYEIGDVVRVDEKGNIEKIAV